MRCVSSACSGSASFARSWAFLCQDHISIFHRWHRPTTIIAHPLKIKKRQDISSGATRRWRCLVVVSSFQSTYPLPHIHDRPEEQIVFPSLTQKTNAHASPIPSNKIQYDEYLSASEATRGVVAFRLSFLIPIHLSTTWSPKAIIQSGADRVSVPQKKYSQVEFETTKMFPSQKQLGRCVVDCVRSSPHCSTTAVNTSQWWFRKRRRCQMLCCRPSELGFCIGGNKPHCCELLRWMVHLEVGEVE
jgi:hypothetical protein